MANKPDPRPLLVEHLRELRSSIDAGLIDKEDAKAIVRAQLDEEKPSPPPTVGDVKRDPGAAPDEPDPPNDPNNDAPELVEIAASGAPLDSDEAWLDAFTDAHNKGDGHKLIGRRSWTTPYRVEDFDTSDDLIATIQADARAEIEAGDVVIQAASGICGPLKPRSAIESVAGAERLIVLPTVDVSGGIGGGGGLRVTQSLTGYDFRAEEAIAFEYDSDDGAAGVSKPVYTVDCPTITNFEVSAFATRLRFGNFQGQFNPELVNHVRDVALAHHSHVVNTALIDAVIAAATTYAVGAAEQGDAWSAFTKQATFHTFLLRDKHEIPDSVPLDLVLSYRAFGALVADVAPRTSTVPTRAGAFAVKQALTGLGQEIGARFQFVADYEPIVDAPGDFGSEDYEFLVIPVGSVIEMTAAELSFMEVRDSARNAANEFESFLESYNGIATTGIEIARATGLSLCPNGATGSTVSITCGTGS